MTRRCSVCAISWPNFLEFARCPKCGEKTALVNNEKPMDLREATSLKRHLEFDRKYAEREAHRQGPSPEDRGRQEAAEIIQLDRQFRRVPCGKCRRPTAPIICEWREPVCPDCWRRMNGDAA